MRPSYLVTLIIILLPILIFFHTHGVITHDEGYILHNAQMTLEGQIPFRDFRFVYTPGSLLLTALSFKLFGVSVLSSRILMLTLSIISTILIYKCVQMPTRNKLYSTIAVLIYVAWGPTHINFSWPVMFVMPFALLACYLALKFLETRNSKYLFFAGFVAFSVFVFKQNFGLAIMLPFIAFFLVKSSREFKYISSFIYGVLWGGIGYIIYLLVTNSFAGFIDDLNFYTIKWILVNKSLNTPFIFNDSLLPMIGRTSLYLTPIIVSIFSVIILLVRRRFHLVFLSLFTASFYIFGIRPTTDYVHLAPIMALIGIPIGLILRYNISTNIRYLIFLISIFFIFLGFQTALFKGYYRWDEPLIRHNNFYGSTANIFINEKSKDVFQNVENLINENTSPFDYIYVDSFNQMLYFISQRKDPMNESFLSLWNGPSTYYERVLGNLVAKEVKILFLRHKSLDTLPIQKYIKANYEFVETIYDYDAYKRLP